MQCHDQEAGSTAEARLAPTRQTNYYNGPTLVELETVGSDVVKRQFTVTEQPDMMEIAVMAITGNAKSETLHLKRMPSTTSR